MTERTDPVRPQDEELASPDAQAGIRSDLGTSGDVPKQEATGDPDAAGDRTRSPRGSGDEAGYGHLGSQTPGEAGSPGADPT